MACLHILIVEDEDSVREILRRFVETLGHNVAAASTAGAALELARNAASAPKLFSIAIVDVRLPDGNGEKLASELAALLPRISVILSGGALDPELASTLVKPPIVALLPKPFSMGDVAAAVKHAARYFE